MHFKMPWLRTNGSKRLRHDGNSKLVNNSNNSMNSKGSLDLILSSSSISTSPCLPLLFSNRVRKALISQLHSLREEAGPKEIQIIKMSEKLNELEKQYEKALKAISEKEQHLQQNSTMVHLLHKQVRELRSSLVQRESSLKRASKLLDEFKYSLQQARFSSRKITVPTGGATVSGGVGVDASDSTTVTTSGHEELDYRRRELFQTKKTDVVELISSTPVMEESLQRLHDVLNPHSTSEVSLSIYLCLSLTHLCRMRLTMETSW
jgi:hypothetical protein